MKEHCIEFAKEEKKTKKQKIKKVLFDESSSKEYERINDSSQSFRKDSVIIPTIIEPKKESKKSWLRFFKKEQINPEFDVEINIVKKKTGFIESHRVYAKERKAVIEGFTYKLKPEGMILEPTKDSFLPVYFFNEGNEEPYNFKNLNKRIPSRVINLLYNTDTYRTWLEMERKNINLILVIIGIATLIILAVYGWLNFLHGALPKIPFIN